MTRLPATLSFRERTKGGAFRSEPYAHPAGALAQSRRVLLLIHGFNNHQLVAQDSYAAFLAEQQKFGEFSQRVVRVYWPGDTGPFDYHYSIGRAQQTAAMLADALVAAARERADGIVVDIVAHSMGCRLSLELIHALQSRAEPRLALGRFVFMAAAVPLQRLLPVEPPFPRELRESFDAARVRVLSLYSPDDVVLRVFFPRGQRKADELRLDVSGYPAVALGYGKWAGSQTIRWPRLVQAHAETCDHSDYWPNRSGAVAPAVRMFLTPTSRRAMPQRGVTFRVRVKRTLANGLQRILPTRSLSGS